MYKATKTSANGDVKTITRATLKDEGEDPDEDMAAGPELPPDEDNRLPEDDDEGRFFGGGLARHTMDVMDFIDEQDKDETVRVDARYVKFEARLTGFIKGFEKVDIAWLRKMALNFEKRISKNAELRAKFEDKPEKYVRGFYTSW